MPSSLAEHKASVPFLGDAPGAQAASTPLVKPADPRQPQQARPAQCQEPAETSEPPHSGNNSHDQGSSQQGTNRQLLSLSDGGQTGSHQAAPDQARPAELYADGGSRHRPADTLLQQSTKAPVSLQQSAKSPAQPRVQKQQHHAATRESHHAMEGLDAGAAGPLELPAQDWDRKDDLSWQTVLNAAGGQHGSIPEGSAAAGRSACLAWQAAMACWLLQLRINRRPDHAHVLPLMVITSRKSHMKCSKLMMTGMLRCAWHHFQYPAGLRAEGSFSFHWDSSAPAPAAVSDNLKRHSMAESQLDSTGR